MDVQGDLIRLEVNTTKSQEKAQSGGEVLFSRPNNPGALPKVTGVNVLSNPPGLNLDIMRDKLKIFGIEIKYIMISRFADGNKLIFLYCMTLHGQYVIIESPPNVKVNYGDIELLTQRIGIIQTSVLDTFKEELNNIYTGYAFINTVGIHYVKKGQLDPIIYEFENESTDHILELEQYHFTLLPAVPYVNLIEPARLNTIEAFINVIDKDKIAKELIDRAGLSLLLTMSGPFTLFLPRKDKLITLKKLSDDKLRATLLAHVVIGRIDTSDLMDSGKSIGKEEIKLLAISNNEIIITKNNGKIDTITSGNKKTKILSTVRKYNGIIHIIDTIFYPISENFKLPIKSDLDDVVTIFDINRSTMEIRKAQYDVNRHNHEQILTVLKFIKETTIKLYDVINEKTKVNGDRLLADSNELVELFYTRDIPCVDQCLKLDQLAKTVKEENIEFETLLKMSNILGAFKIPIEQMYEKILKVDQRIHIKNLINTGAGIVNNKDDEDDDDYDE
jgi:uncharacterized surface protein with fasciclin (FAS1) repeats